MFDKLLIANRGEIACRITRTAKRMGICTVAVHSDADQNAAHVRHADEAVNIGPAPSSQSYLNIEAVLEAARATGAQSIHPGYGFLSENPDFVEAVDRAGLVFVGPSLETVRAMGLKDAAKKLMEQAGIPVVPGYHGEEQAADFLKKQADQIGYPVLIKARAGGGGKGMRLVEDAEQFDHALISAKGEAQASFGDDSVLIEKFISCPRHIEIQVFGDQQGNIIHLFERDCSLQRRHQKVIEEAPAPGISPIMRRAMGEAAVAAARAVHYVGAGTVEFIVDGAKTLDHGDGEGGFWFMEMNTRLQVEHPVTEMITGLDLVEMQLKIAAGHPMDLRQDDVQMSGWSMEARIYAEEPENEFLPSIGTISTMEFPDKCRLDSGVEKGDAISSYYDPMIGKLISWAENRDQARSQLAASLARSKIGGVGNNLGFLHRVLTHDEFADGGTDTGFIEREKQTLCLLPEVKPYHLAMMFWLANRLDCARRPGWRIWGAGYAYITAQFRAENFDLCLKFCDDGQNILSDRITGQVIGTVGYVEVYGGKIEVRLGKQTHQCAFECSDESISLYEGADRLDFVLPQTEFAADHEEEGQDKIVSPMPGQVFKVHVAPGDRVKKGDCLVVVEAMKMQHAMTAPKDGCVTEVHAGEGDQLEDGAILVVLESGSDKP